MSFNDNKNFLENHNYIQEIRIEKPKQTMEEKYPFSIPAIQEFKTMELGAPVSIFVGENGSGKSTILEAIAIAAGFNPEGGSINFSFSTKDSYSVLNEYIQLVRGVYRPKDGYFLRAESFYNVATNIEELDRTVPGLYHSYGGKSLHDQSHGESFLALVENRFSPNGLYLLDEPEAALSPTNQLVLLRYICDLVKKGSQFLICTHSPILLCCPNAQVYELSREKGRAICRMDYRETNLFRFYSGFLRSPQRVIAALLEE